MNKDEYIELRKKEMRLVMIKIAEKDKVKAFDIIFKAPFPAICLPNEEYRISELVLRILNKEGIEYEVIK